jgi:hypothetical protein
MASLRLAAPGVTARGAHKESKGKEVREGYRVVRGMVVKVPPAPTSAPADPQPSAPIATTVRADPASPGAAAPAADTPGARQEPEGRPAAPAPGRRHLPLPVPLTGAVSELQFWMCWATSQGAPRYRHQTKEGAVGEARRLAKSFPGVRVLVLEVRAVGEECQGKEVSP